MGTPSEILDMMEAPILFALRNPHRPIIGLETGLTVMTDSLRRGIEKENRLLECQPFLMELASILSSLESLSPEGRLARLEEALRILRVLRASLPIENFPSPPPLSIKVPPDFQMSDVEKSFAELKRPIRFIRGIGPRISSRLECKGIHTVEDLLYFLPRRYEDRRIVQKISEAQIGRRATVVAKVIDCEVRHYAKKGVLEATFTDGSGVLKVKWFHGFSLYLRRFLKKDSRFILSGEIGSFHFDKIMIHPDFELLSDQEEDSLHFRRIVPVYSETEGLHQKNIRRIMKEVVERYAPLILSPIPEALCRRRGLLEIHKAMGSVHFPPQDGDVNAYNGAASSAHHRMIYDEFFFFHLGMALRKKGTLDQNGPLLNKGFRMVRDFHSILPFELTAAQKRVIAEIERDLTSGRPMNRLLQGDVGSGKTVVAMSAVSMACGSGFQAAMMAPTEILATQHYKNILNWCHTLNLKIALLTGGMSASAKKTVQEDIAGGRTQVVVGTHTLIQRDTNFHNLGLAVIDEQHRFGVIQRASLRKKGQNPHVLVMTATPIPRTLAMTIFGDLDISVMDEMPPGKMPVETRVCQERHRDRVYEMIRSELMKGNQVFIVYPLVDESEALDLKDATRMAEHLAKNVFPEHSVGLIHGKMNERDRAAAMEAFRNGEISLLVATTVIEVGIDIPQASLMVIEHSERFGLSQLHQLRGRVGRGNIPSKCILMVQKASTVDSKKRLRIMELTNDGFRIAEEDLVIRGPGEFMGTRQSGIPDFRVADIVRDMKILEEARKDAFSIVEDDPVLGKPENHLLREVVLRRWDGRLDLAKTG